MNRLELYGIGLLVLVLVILGAYAKGHDSGYVAAERKSEAALNKANAKIDELQQKKDEAARESSERYETERTRHEAELAAARSSVSERLCRPVANPVKVPEGERASASTSSAGAGAAVPPAAQGTDEWRYAFVAACQHDSDALRGWQDWWATQQSGAN